MEQETPPDAESGAEILDPKSCHPGRRSRLFLREADSRYAIPLLVLEWRVPISGRSRLRDRQRTRAMKATSYILIWRVATELIRDKVPSRVLRTFPKLSLRGHIPDMLKASERPTADNLS